MSKPRFFLLVAFLLVAGYAFSQTAGSTLIRTFNATSTAGSETTVIYDDPTNRSAGTELTKVNGATTTGQITKTIPADTQWFRPVFIGMATPTADDPNVLYMWYATSTNKLMFKFTTGVGGASASGALN